MFDDRYVLMYTHFDICTILVSAKVLDGEDIPWSSTVQGESFDGKKFVLEERPTMGGISGNTKVFLDEVVDYKSKPKGKMGSFKRVSSSSSLLQTLAAKATVDQAGTVDDTGSAGSGGRKCYVCGTFSKSPSRISDGSCPHRACASLRCRNILSDLWVDIKAGIRDDAESCVSMKLGGGSDRPNKVLVGADSVAELPAHLRRAAKSRDGVKVVPDCGATSSGSGLVMTGAAPSDARARFKAPLVPRSQKRTLTIELSDSSFRNSLFTHLSFYLLLSYLVQFIQRYGKIY